MMFPATRPSTNSNIHTARRCVARGRDGSRVDVRSYFDVGHIEGDGHGEVVLRLVLQRGHRRVSLASRRCTRCSMASFFNEDISSDTSRRHDDAQDVPMRRGL